jgi:hypothetical protein
MSIMVSPHHPDTKFDNPTVDDLIDVFEDRIRSWVLLPAKGLLETEHGQIAGFCLVLTYFEGIWSYIEGRSSRGHSRQFFEQAFVDVFRSTGLAESLLTRVAGLLYTDARCGFFHDGMFREHLYFAGLSKAEILITLPKKDGQIDEHGEIQSLLIDPQRFYSAVERHFDRIVVGLRDASNVDLRAKFRASFKEQCDWEKVGPAIGIPEPAHGAT